jgi:membrane-associated protease RseP (regulator of RpoE activity)
MKIRLFSLLALFVATTAFAETDNATSRRTIVVRDGKVVTDTGAVPGRDRVHFLDVIGGKRAYLGVVLTDLTEELREHYGASKNAGVLVGSVADNSPAAKAGVRVGDLVLAVDGADIDSALDLRRALTNKKEGDSVRLELLRGRSRQTAVIAVTEREVPGVFNARDFEDLRGRLDSPEWRARLETLRPANCVDLQARIKELETRLKDLEKKLQR